MFWFAKKVLDVSINGIYKNQIHQYDNNSIAFAIERICEHKTREINQTIKERSRGYTGKIIELLQKKYISRQSSAQCSLVWQSYGLYLNIMSCHHMKRKKEYYKQVKTKIAWDPDQEFEYSIWISIIKNNDWY